MISRLLNKITGRDVRFVFFVIAVGLGLFQLHGGHRIAFVALVLLAGANWVFPVLGKDQKFTNFADPKYWPSFVMLGIAACVGHQSFWLVGSIFGILDGMYFGQNY